LDDYLLVARILRNYGFDGYLSVKSFTDFSDTLFSLRDAYIYVFGDYRKFVVEEALEKNGQILIKFKNFDSFDDVVFLFKKNIYIKAENARKLDKDEYYVHDLIGLKTFQKDLFFGEVIDVLTLAANDVLVVRRTDGKEALVPFVGEFVFNVDLKNKRIDISDKEDFTYEDEDDEN